MARSIQYENDFIVGGSATRKITPNFKLSEFMSAAGDVFIHRELIAGLQVLRNAMGHPVDITDLKAPASIGSRPVGHGVVIQSKNAELLLKSARKLKLDNYFSVVEPIPGKLYVESPGASEMRSIKPETAFDCGMQVTAAYETSGDPYQQVTGNFDGAGLSFGPIQCNLLSGTLQDLFRRIRGEDEKRLLDCFDNNESDYKAFWRVLDGSIRKAVKWGDDQSTRRTKHGFRQPWKRYLQAVGREPAFRRVMLIYAYDKYGKRVLAVLSFLQAISPLKIENLRCLAALYDMCVQQGSLKKAESEIRNRIFQEMPADEFALTKIVVEERAIKASRRWRADCLSRRLSILDRAPVEVRINGQRARRNNPSFYLLRNSPIKDLDHYLEN